MRESSRKEEHKLKEAVRECEKAIEGVQKDKEKMEKGLREEVRREQEEVAKIRQEREDMECFYENELNKIKDVAKQEIKLLKA